ncbi:hypothetical protein ABD91_21210 [Lysinibacillus sphaericus]|uniref:hypothetical protein n=1 Tax=Lysinibacillus sphaericus TaxID=1421 RepID=UPI0018CE0CA4|nr:hypothetical protein [Lysinibacillus sphaericus]MBG9693259.1 hypothetical protein [Lysinibacillus sphaericus]
MLVPILLSVALGITGLLVLQHYIDKKQKESRQLELERRELIILVERIRYCWFSIIGYDIENPLYLRLHEMSRFLNALNEAELARMTELCYGDMISLRKIDNASKSAAFTNSSIVLIELLGMVLDNLDKHKQICVENSSSEIIEELHVVKGLNAKKANELNFFSNISDSQSLKMSEIAFVEITNQSETGVDNKEPRTFSELIGKYESGDLKCKKRSYLED